MGEEEEEEEGGESAVGRGLDKVQSALVAKFLPMLERFLRRAERKEDLRHVALLLHRLHFCNNNT